MMVTGAESKVAQVRPVTVDSAPSGLREGGAGSEMSRESWKLLAFAVPVT